MQIRFEQGVSTSNRKESEAHSLNSRLSLEHLSIFTSAARNGSFAAAARQHQKSISSISNAISCMEIDLGIALFDRSGYRAVLTEAGKQILKQANKIIHNVQHMEQIAESHANNRSQTMRILVDACIPYAQFHQQICQFRQSQPTIEVEILVKSILDCIKLWSASSDLIYIGRRIKNCREIKSRIEIKLAKMSFLPVVSKGHPLAKEHSPLQDCSLNEWPQVILQHRLVGEALFFTGQDMCYVDGIHICRDLIQTGKFWGYLPDHLVDLQTMHVLQIDGFCIPEHDIYMQSSHTEDQRNLAEELLEYFAKSNHPQRQTLKRA